MWVPHPNVTSMEICQSINFNKLRAQHIIKKLCFCVFLKVSFDNLFDNLESGKYINKSLGETSAKSLDYDFGSKNLYITDPGKQKG